MALLDYLAGEVGEDWAVGILSRREAFNDTGARYNAEQAKAAYADVLAGLASYLG